MKKLAFCAIAVALVASTPVLAQGVSIRTGEGGISIRAGDRDRDRRRTVIRERRGPDRVIVRGGRDCKTVVIRERDDFGNRVTKKIRRC